MDGGRAISPPLSGLPEGRDPTRHCCWHGHPPGLCDPPCDRNLPVLAGTCNARRANLHFCHGALRSAVFPNRSRPEVFRASWSGGSRDRLYGDRVSALAATGVQQAETGRLSASRRENSAGDFATEPVRSRRVGCDKEVGTRLARRLGFALPFRDAKPSSISTRQPP